MILAALALTLCPAQGTRADCVVDGDTAWIGREKIRLSEIDTPELNGKCPSERQRAIEARDALLAMLNSGEVAIYRSGTDRYGRSLARVTVNGRDVGDAMVRQGYARRWAGRREPWC